jgi:nucleoside-diphosphate-sugar epimerase
VFQSTASFSGVLVTGGGGWLGKRVVGALATGELDDAELPKIRTDRIRCLVAPGEELQDVARLGVETVTGDVRDAEAVSRFVMNFEGALLIHLAGIIHPAWVRDFEAINTEGTLGLLAAASDVGVARVVVMSSNSPMGCNPSPTHRFTEESPYNPYMGYGRSKWLMEVGLREMIDKPRAPEIAIIRSPWFYGPGQPPRQTQFFGMIKNGSFPIIGDGNNRRSMGYLDNLVQGILLAATHPGAAGEIFWIADEIPYSMNQIIETVGRVMRNDFGFAVKRNKLRLPWMVGEVATLTDSVLQGLGIYQQKIHVLSEINKTIACSIQKAKRVMGYKPTIVLEEGMRRSIKWCLDNGVQI